MEMVIKNIVIEGDALHYLDNIADNVDNIDNIYKYEVRIKYILKEFPHEYIVDYTDALIHIKTRMILKNMLKI